MEKMTSDIINYTETRSDHKDKSVIGEIAKEYGLKNGKPIRMAQENNVLNSNGVNTLFKIRTGTFNYSDNILRMLKPSLDPAIISGLEKRCLCCKVETKENIEHILLFCKSFDMERKKHLNPIIEKIKTQTSSEKKLNNVKVRTLLGGETPASGRKTADNLVYTINYLSSIIPKRAAIIAGLRNTDLNTNNFNM